MKRLRATVAAVALTLFATRALAQGLNFDEFKPTTLVRAKASFLANAQEPISGVQDKPNNTYFDQGGGWRVRASFTGRFRPLEGEELEFFLNWIKSIGRENVVGMFKASYLFTENGKDYWLPVESQVAVHFPKELKRGDMVDLYLAELGGTRRRNGWTWLPLVEEFRKVKRSG